MKAGIRKNSIEIGRCGVFELLGSEGDIDGLIPCLWHVLTILVNAECERSKVINIRQTYVTPSQSHISAKKSHILTTICEEDSVVLVQPCTGITEL